MSRFVIRRDGRSYTADSEEELVSWAQGGRIARSDLIHVNDGAGWRKASDIDFLAGCLSEPESPTKDQPPIVYWTRRGTQNRLVGDLEVLVAWIRDGSLRPEDLIFHAGCKSWFELRDSAFLLAIAEGKSAVHSVLPDAVDPVIDSVHEMSDDFLSQVEQTNADSVSMEPVGQRTGRLTTEETRRIVEGVLNTDEFEVGDQLTSSTTLTALSPFFSERAKIWADRLEGLPSDSTALLDDRHNLFPIIYDVARCFLDLKSGKGAKRPSTVDLSSIGYTFECANQKEAYSKLCDALDEHLNDRVAGVLGILVETERAGFRRYVEGLLEVMFWLNEMIKPSEDEDDNTAEMHTVTAEAEPIFRLETAIRQLILVRERHV